MKIQVFIDESKFNQAKKWLEYIPDGWHLEELAEKRAGDLTSYELQILLQAKKDTDLLRKLEHVLSFWGETHYVCPKMAEQIDEIYAYVDSKAFTIKITPEEREYVEMLLSELDFDNASTMDLAYKAIDNIENEFLRWYTEDKMREAHASYAADKSRLNAGFITRRKKQHSVTPRIPNRIK